MNEGRLLDAAAGGGGDADRTSKLPDEIIHKILYHLDAPKQAARTSVLSRRWLQLWQSYPVMEFRLEEFETPAAGYRMFQAFTAASTRRLSSWRTPFDAFRLSLPRYIQCVQDQDVARLLAWALGGADYGSPLEVVIGTYWYYSLPVGSLSNCSRTKVLQLEGGGLNGLGTVSLHSLQVLNLDSGLGTVSLHSLQVLNLDSVEVTEQSLFNFLCNAPNLESLSLDYCSGIQRLEVSINNFPKLKTLKIANSDYGSWFELQLTTAPFLERLVFIGKCKLLRTLSLSSAPNLKFVRIFGPMLDLGDFIPKLPSLRLLKINSIELLTNSPRMELQLTSVAPCLKTFLIVDVISLRKLNIQSLSAALNPKALKLDVPKGFTQSCLEDLISKLPSLESLVLGINDLCDSGVRSLRVSSRQLRVFKLHDHCSSSLAEPLEVLAIDAPNLVSAEYNESGFRFPGKIDVVNVASDCRFLVQGHGDLLTEPGLIYKLRHALSELSKFHLVLQWPFLNLSEPVSFDSSQAKCSSPPLIVQHLDFGYLVLLGNQANERNCVTFLDLLFWTCHPKSISITPIINVDSFIEFMYKQLKNKDVAVKCCVGKKCWRHKLEDVKIEKEKTVETSVNKTDCSMEPIKVMFTLTWR